MGNKGNILLVCGHGAGDSGAGGHGYNEAERVRAIAASMQRQGAGTVHVSDTSKNPYTETKAGRGYYYINAKDYDEVMELHLDSYNGSAKGGHVIVDGDLTADAIDKAVRDMVVKRFPGRSNTISYRNDLLSNNVCQRRGISFRLTELCFIDNYSDITKYNAEIDAYAADLVAALGGKVGPSPAPDPDPVPTPGDLNVDGWWGQLTTKKIQAALGTTRDGIISNQYAADLAAINANGRIEQYHARTGSGTYEVNPVKGYRSQMVYNMQQLLNNKGFSCGLDGLFGKNTARALQRFLNSKGSYNLTIDGWLGEKSVKALQSVLNAGKFN